MARRVPPADPALTTTGAQPAIASMTPTPALPGGTSGVIETASSTIHFPGVPTSSAAPSPEPIGEIPKLARYEVVDCPKPPGGTHGFRVMVNGCLGYLTDGKVVDANTYDIDALKRQGVKLRHLGDF